MSNGKIASVLFLGSILAAAALSMISCEKSENHSSRASGQPGARPHDRSEVESDPRRLWLAEIAKKPDNIDVMSHVKNLSKKEDLKIGSAFDELYLISIKGRSKAERMYLKSIFVRSIFEDENASEILSDLPSGDLRKDSVSYIRGGSFGVDEIYKYYQNMPESSDRKQLAQMYVSKTYFSSGVPAALEAIRGLDQESEKMESFGALIQQISGAVALRGGEISSSEIDQLRSFAERNGIKDTIAEINSIPVK